MIRFGSKYFKIENVTELVADNGEFGLEFRRLCKKKVQEDLFLFLRDIERRRPPQEIYMEFLIPTMPRTNGNNLHSYDATTHFPFGHRPKMHLVAVPNRVRVNIGRGINISDRARNPLIALANANRWSEALWRPALDIAAAEVSQLLHNNNTVNEYYASNDFLKLFDRLVMTSVQQQHASTFALTEGLPSAVKNDGRLLQFLRYAKASIFFGHDDIDCTTRKQMFRRAADEMLNGLKADHGITNTFDSLKTGAWAA